MKIKILSACYVGGKPRAIGDIVDARKDELPDILGTKRGEIYTGEKEANPTEATTKAPGDQKPKKPKKEDTQDA